MRRLVPGAFGRNNEKYSDPTASQAIYNITKEERKSETMEGRTVIERGSIFYIESLFNETGSEQRAGRPAIIVSNEKNNENADMVEVVYLTTKEKVELPTHVTIRSAARQSTALCEQISTVSIQRLGAFSGKCTKAEMEQIDMACAISLALDFPAPKVVEKIVEKPVEKIVERVVEKPSADGYAVNRDSKKWQEVLERNAQYPKIEAERDVYKKLYEDLLAKVIKN